MAIDDESDQSPAGLVPALRVDRAISAQLSSERGTAERFGRLGAS
jgi:hypothetical protein